MPVLTEFVWKLISKLVLNVLDLNLIDHLNYGIIYYYISMTTSISKDHVGKILKFDTSLEPQPHSFSSDYFLVPITLALVEQRMFLINYISL